MRKKLKVAWLFTVCMSSAGLVSTFTMAEDAFDCGGNTAKGIYTGKLVKVMDQNIWPRTTYEFNWLVNGTAVDNKEMKRGCLKIDDKNLIGAQMMYDAYKLGRIITVVVNDKPASFVDSISMRD